MNLGAAPTRVTLHQSQMAQRHQENLESPQGLWQMSLQVKGVFGGQDLDWGDVGPHHKRSQGQSQL